MQAHAVTELLLTLPEILTARDKLEDRFARARGDSIGSLLRHAVSTVPRYRVMAADAHRNLRDFPLSDRRCLVEAGAGCLSTAYAPDELAQCTTSGTSGVPLTVYRDEASRYDDYFRTYCLAARLWAGIGQSFAPGRCGVLSVTDNVHKPSGGAVNPSLGNALVLWRQARTVGHELTGWCVGGPNGSALIPIVAGRPSALLALCRSPSAAGAIGAHAVLCSGENLHGDVRREIEKTLGAPTYNGYASREGGFMAVECRYRRGLHALPGRVHFEVLASDESVSDEGEGRLVVTNLWNWAMPVIRYVTDDVAVVRFTECPCGFAGQTLVELYGRDAVYFRVGADMFNPSLLDTIFEGACLEYHVAQVSSDGFEVAYHADRDLDDHIRRGMARLLPTANVKIRRLADYSGTESKRPRYHVGPAPSVDPCRSKPIDAGGERCLLPMTRRHTQG